ncbi:MAG: LysR family transcriptional regulator [Leuconostoc citreum]
MQVNDLMYYNALYREKNFTKVAKIFGISQPSISSAIKRLENFFQIKLVIRGNAQSELKFTAAGEQLHEHSLSILNEIDSAKHELDHLRSHTTTIGLPPIIKNAYFAKIAMATKEFDRQFNISHMNIYEAGSNSLKQSLIDGDIDIALLGSLGDDVDDKLQIFPFAKTTFYVYMSAKNPLAKNPGLYFEALKEQLFISLDSSFIHEQAIKLLSRKAGYRPKTFMKTSDVYFLMSLVAENLGIAILTNIVKSNHDDIIMVPLLDSSQPTFNVNVAFRKNHVLTTEERMLMNILSQQL